MNMLAMTQVERPSLHTIFDSLKLNPVWPEPELSCGILYCQYGKDKCWEAIHDVQRLYNERLRQEIEDLVDDVQDELQRSSNTSPFFGHSIYMVGRKKKRANPFVFFHCRLEAPRSKAASILKGSKIMKEYPAIRVSHVPVPPESHALPRYATGAGGLTVSFVDQPSVFARRLPNGLCGVKVIIDNGRSVPEWVHATIGGCILLRGQYYGLTASHGMQPAITELEDIECEGDLCTYPGYNDDDSDDEELSSDCDHSEEIEDLKWKGKQTTPYSNDGLDTADIVSPFDVLFGTLKYTSIENGRLGLDWALVEISDHVLQLDFSMNEMPPRVPTQTYRHAFPLKGIVQSLPQSSNSNYKHPIIAVTGRSGRIAGWISGTSVSMQLPGAARLQELWSVRLEAPIEQGDCGSFVVDPLNGNVFGHIVAGNLERGLVYIVPAWKTQNDIARQLGSTFTFPGDNSRRSISASSIDSEGNFNVPLSIERILPPGRRFVGVGLNRWLHNKSPPDDSGRISSPSATPFSPPESEWKPISEDEESMIPQPTLTLRYAEQGKDGDTATPNFKPQNTGLSDTMQTALPQFQTRDDDTATANFKSRYPGSPDEVKNALPQLEGASWPSTELSIGNPIEPLGSYSCWKAIGPAEPILTALVIEIEHLFSGMSEELNFTTMMIGRTAQTASPAIAIQSQNHQLLKEATALLRKSHIMDSFPASIRVVEIGGLLNSSELLDEKTV